MHIEKTRIAGLYIIRNMEFTDQRGAFKKIFETSNPLFNNFSIKQVNFSHNTYSGTIRGLHFQEKKTDAKIVTCLRGAAYDVAVDLRKNSPSFGNHLGILINDENRTAFYIPKGFAHGFQTLEDGTDLLYLHDEEFLPFEQRGVSAFSEELGITWPLPVTKISEQDEALEKFTMQNKENFDEM